MRKFQRHLLGLLALAMVLVLVPKRVIIASGAGAAEEEDGDIIIDIGGQNTVASGSCGEGLTWKLNGNGVLTVSGTGAMTNYASTGNRPWNSKSSSITAVVVENGVTRIGNRAFSGCTGLTTVTIAAGVTAIGTQAFYNCTGLKNVNYGGASTHWAQISVGSGNTPLKSAAISFAKELTGITVSAPDKTAYLRGEPLELAGMTVTANYSDGSAETVSAYAVTGYDPDTLGAQTVTVTYEGFTETFLVTVERAVLYGDVNGDGEVNTRDRVLLTRYLAQWEDCTVDPEAADVNRDGEVNARDRVILSRYLADWQEYSQLPYTE